MTNDEFSKLVARNTELAQRNPAGYRLRVAGLALLGYAYMFGMVLVAGLLSVALTAVLLLKPILLLKLIKVIWVPIALAWALLKSLFMRIPPPEGTPITAQQAPALFAEIEQQRSAQTAAPIHQVLITDEFNAAVAQRPRFGPFWGSRNTLILGYRLMTAFSPEQFRAVLAHELGHLSAAHGYWGARIYHLRRTWGTVQQTVNDNGGVAQWMVGKFLNWYAPYFNAYTFVLARQQEYEADAAAVRVVGAPAAASALVAVNVVHSWQGDHFWTPLLAQARKEAAPSRNPYAEMLQRPALPDNLAEVSQPLQQALREETGLDDTHPSLSDRLKAMDSPPVLAPAHGPNAAQIFLGTHAEVLAASFGKQWQERNAEGWREHFETAEAERAELQVLEGQRSNGPLDIEAQYRYAQLIELEHKNPSAACALLRALLVEAPHHLSAHFTLGRLLLEADDASGLEHLEAACQADEVAICPAAELAHRYLKNQNRDDDAQTWAKRWQVQHDRQQQIDQERSSFTVSDHYLAHGLAAAELTTLQAALANNSGLGKAWLVQKQLSLLQTERPAYLLIAALPWNTLSKASAAQALESALQKALNSCWADTPTLLGSVTVVVQVAPYLELAKRALKSGGKEVWPT